jgi:hypothetical protein
MDAPFLDERDLVASDNVYETWRTAHGQPLGEQIAKAVQEANRAEVL